MPLRRFRICLDVSEPRILYCWHYDPPGQGAGVGDVLPKGTLHGIPYDALLALGNGWHSIEFDEAARSKIGYPPVEMTADNRRVEKLRRELFSNKCGVSTKGTVEWAVILGMSPGAADRIIPLLSQDHLAMLKRFAQRIADTPEERQRRWKEYALFSSAGLTPVPDEVLAEIRRRFRE